MLHAEILALRHQLLVLQRTNRERKLRLDGADRVLWVGLAQLWGKWRSALLIIKPETVIAKVRNGFTPMTRRRVAEHFNGLEMSRCPFANLPDTGGTRFGKALDAAAMKDCKWLKPKLRRAN